MTMQAVSIKDAVASAVDLVNRHPGEASIVLRFGGVDVPEIDFVANSARLEGERFMFTAGFEKFDGSVRELSDIRAELIQ